MSNYTRVRANSNSIETQLYNLLAEASRLGGEVVKLPHGYAVFVREEDKTGTKKSGSTSLRLSTWPQEKIPTEIQLATKWTKHYLHKVWSEFYFVDNLPEDMVGDERQKILEKLAEILPAIIAQARHQKSLRGNSGPHMAELRKLLDPLPAVEEKQQDLFHA